MRKVKHRMWEKKFKAEYDQAEEAREQLIDAIGALVKERAPKVYDELSMYFDGLSAGLTITMTWEELASILFVTHEDALDKGDFDKDK